MNALLALDFFIHLGSFLLLNKASTTPQPKSSELIIIINKLTELTRATTIKKLHVITGYSYIVDTMQEVRHLMKRVLALNFVEIIISGS